MKKINNMKICIPKIDLLKNKLKEISNIDKIKWLILYMEQF